jgi:hypothetical protein
MKVTLAHLNTEITSIPLDIKNDKVSWIVVERNDKSKVMFFPTGCAMVAKCDIEKILKRLENDLIMLKCGDPRVKEDIAVVNGKIALLKSML